MIRLLLVCMLIGTVGAPLLDAPIVRVERWQHRAADWLAGTHTNTVARNAALRLRNGHATGSYTSLSLQATAPFTALAISWQTTLDPGQTLQLLLRTSVDGNGWSAWQPLVLSAPAALPMPQIVAVDPGQRWLQYEVQFDAPLGSPALDALDITMIDTGIGSILADVQPQPLDTAIADAPLVIPFGAWSGELFQPAQPPQPPRRVGVQAIATTQPTADPFAALRAVRWTMREQMVGAELPFHLLVDAQGRLYQGPGVLRATTPLQIGVLTLPGGDLTEAQQTSLADLLAWLARTYRTESVVDAAQGSDLFKAALAQVERQASAQTVNWKRWFVTPSAAPQRLTLYNPTMTASRATVTVSTPSGEQQSELDVPAMQRSEVALTTMVSDTLVQSVVLTANQPLHAERIMSDGTTLLSSSGVAQPSRTWYVAAAATISDTQTLHLFNPAPIEVDTQLMVYGAGAPVTQTLTLAPRAVTPLVLNDLVPGAEVGVQVSAAQPVVVERTMRRSDDTIDLASASPMLERHWSFAEGITTASYTTTLHLLNPWAQRVALTLQLMSEDGTSLTRRYAVEPETTLQLPLNQILPDLRFAVEVQAERPLLAERVTQPALSQRASVTVGSPALATRWIFATGTTRNAEQFILVGNPQRRATELEIRYILADGSVVERRARVLPAARLTIRTNQAVPDQPAMTMIVTASQPVVAERTLVFDTPGREYMETRVGEAAK